MIRKTVLRNGIRLITQTLPHAHSVSMGVWVNAGARDESDTESGISHFIEHMMFKGTTSKTAYELAKAFDAMGGNANAYTSMEHTCYHAKALNIHTRDMADMFTDIFLNSTFAQEEIEKEKPVVLQEILMVEDSPEELIHQLYDHQFWGSHPLGRSILGTPEHLSGFHTEKLKSFFHRFYQPERIVISMAGNISHEEALDLFGPAFEAVTSDSGFPAREIPVPRFSVAVHSRPIEQVHLCLGTECLSATDPRRFTATVLSTMLGGNMSSRLFQEIREKRGLAYNVYSFTLSHCDAGQFGVYAAVSPKNVNTTIALIRDALTRITETPVTAQELEAAKNFIRGNIFMAAESTDSCMARAAQNEMYLGRYMPLSEIAENIDQVTIDGVLDLARTLFSPGRLCLSAIGPDLSQKTIEEILYS